MSSNEAKQESQQEPLHELVEALRQQVADLSSQLETQAAELRVLETGCYDMDHELRELSQWVHQHHPRTSNCSRCGARLLRKDRKCARCQHQN